MATPQDRPSAVTRFPPGSHRLSAASGIAFVALIVASAILYGFHYPTYDDTGRVFAAYYADNSSRIEVSVLLAGFSAAALVWFMGFVRWLYRGAETAARGFARATDIGYAAGIAGVAVSVITVAAQQAAVVAAGTVAPGVIRALDLFGDYVFLMAGLFLSIWLISSFFVIRVTKVLPDWLAFAAVAGTILGLLQATLVLAPQDDDGVLGLFGILFVLVLVVWTLAASITIARRAEASRHAGG